MPDPRASVHKKSKKATSTHVGRAASGCGVGAGAGASGSSVTAVLTKSASLAARSESWNRIKCTEPVNFQRFGTASTHERHGHSSHEEEEEEEARVYTTSLPRLNMAVRAVGGLTRQRIETSGGGGGWKGAQTAMGLVSAHSPSHALHLGVLDKSQRLLAQLGSL